jgi:hypothetical protein
MFDLCDQAGCSKTAICLEMACWETRNGAASSFTEAGPRRRRARIAVVWGGPMPRTPDQALSLPSAPASEISECNTNNHLVVLYCGGAGKRPPPTGLRGLGCNRSLVLRNDCRICLCTSVATSAPSSACSATPRVGR